MHRPTETALKMLPHAPIGSLGHLSIFLWALGLALLPFHQDGWVFGLIVLAALGSLYPFALGRLARPRWLVILAGIFFINLFFGGREQPPDWVLWGLPLSSAALLDGAQMTLRAVILLLAADGISASVNISEIAGLFERGGLRGLGFSLGVAVNLLPDLRASSLTTWHSLRMRGGLRANWRRGLQLLALTILTNALRHAEEIVLAAEARAFQPQYRRKVPLRIGSLDAWMAAFCVMSFLVALYFSLH